MGSLRLVGNDHDRGNEPDDEGEHANTVHGFDLDFEGEDRTIVGVAPTFPADGMDDPPPAAGAAPPRIFDDVAVAYALGVLDEVDPATTASAPVFDTAASALADEAPIAYPAPAGYPPRPSRPPATPAPPAYARPVPSPSRPYPITGEFSTSERVQVQPSYEALPAYAPPAGNRPSYEALPAYAPPLGNAHVAPEVRVPSPALPVAPAGGARRVLLIAGLAVVLIGGAAIGWIVFARDDDNARPVVAATPADPPVVKSVAPPVAPAKPVVTTTTAEIASLEHPALGEIASPVSGEVASVFLTGPTTVAVGDKLFAIRSVSGGTNTAALTKRIAELEVLVEKDPTVYEPFLSRAKRDLSRAKPQVAITAVNATVAGLIDTGVKPGTHVQAGSVLGTVRDARTWTAVAVVRGIKPRPNWSCAVATRDDSHVSVCTIETTEASPDVGGDVRVTVEIAANKASWLEGLDQHPRLVLDPPQAP